MRLAFAVAINIEPEILIVDEALSVGDVFFQAKCYHKFEEFKKEGKTVLFVSHDLSNISKYCDRVVLLNKGHKLGEGSPKEMIDIYKQVLVGQYDPNGRNDHLDSLPPGMSADDAIYAAASKKADEADAKIKGDSAERARAAAERLMVNAEGAETEGNSANRPHSRKETTPLKTPEELSEAEKKPQRMRRKVRISPRSAMSRRSNTDHIKQRSQNTGSQMIRAIVHLQYLRVQYVRYT